MQRLHYPVFATHDDGNMKQFPSMSDTRKWIFQEYKKKFDNKQFCHMVDAKSKFNGWLFEMPTRISLPIIKQNTKGRAITLHHKDTGRVLNFKSISKAAEWMNKNVPNLPFKKVTCDNISCRILTKGCICGWYFEDKNIENTDHQITALNPLTFVFGEEAEDMFKNKSVRITNDHPKRVSVYDVIQVVTQLTDVWQVYHRLQHSFPEVSSYVQDFHFESGQGQRPTPVADMNGILYIVNLLPGPNAAKFRNGTVNLLVRFMSGDVTLKDTIDNINEFHESGVGSGTITELIREPIQNKYALLSPTMIGKDLSYFKEKDLVYLLTFMHENKLHIKFGRTGNICVRMIDHFREIPGVQIYTLHETKNPQRVETQLKEKMKYMGLLIDIIVNGKKQTEIIHGITESEAEDILVKMIDDVEPTTVSDKEDSEEYKIAKLNVEVKMKELEQSTALIDLLKQHPEYITPELLLKLAK